MQIDPAIFFSVIEQLLIAIDGNGKVLFSNEYVSTFLGADKKLAPGVDFFSAFFDPSVSQEMRAIFDEIVAHPRDSEKEIEFPVTAADGGMKILSWRIITRKNRDDSVIVLYIGRDITLLKEVEVKHLEAETQVIHLNKVLFAIRNVNQLILHEHDPSILIQAICEQLTEKRGYNTAWILLADSSKHFSGYAVSGFNIDFSLPKQRWLDGPLSPCSELAIDSSEVIVFSNREQCCDRCPFSNFETIPEMTIMSSRLEYESSIYGVLTVSVLSDISVDEQEKKLFLELAADIGFALHNIELIEEQAKAEKRYQELFESISSGVAVYEVVDGGDDFVFRAFNKAGESIEHIAREEIIGRRVTEVFPGVREFGLLNVFKRVWESGKPEYFPATQYRDQRIIGWRDNYVYRLSSHEVVAVYTDVTAQKQFEEELCRFKKIFDIANYGVMFASLDGTVEYINNYFAQLHGYSAIELTGKNYSLFYDDSQAVDVGATIHALLHDGSFSAKEEWHINRDGIAFPVLMSGLIIQDDNNLPALLAVAAIDISERKRAEKLIKDNLREKETLLKEIHHRVKNNLNIITSLLDLQSMQVKNKAQAMRAFKESKNRIRSMALVHERLYQSENFSNIEIRPYILSLVSELLHMSGAEGKVEVESQIQDLSFDISIAIPCGLILNELITNVLKHAYAEGAKGHLLLVFHGLGDDQYELRVEDNGKGLPEFVDIEQSSTFGLQLVGILTEQMGGVISVVVDKGTKYSVRFFYDGNG